MWQGLSRTGDDSPERLVLHRSTVRRDETGVRHVPCGEFALANEQRPLGQDSIADCRRTIEAEWISVARVHRKCDAAHRDSTHDETRDELNLAHWSRQAAMARKLIHDRNILLVQCREPQGCSPYSNGSRIPSVASAARISRSSGESLSRALIYPSQRRIAR